jgi:hypothetical protein
LSLVVAPTCRARPSAAGSRCGIDSDHDVLQDDYETYGYDAGFPQKLPTWGADPLQKDLFVEVD